MTASGSRLPGRAALLALAVLLLLAPARAASAHAALLATDPADGAVLDAAPEAVTLSFNEQVQPVDEGIRLVDGDGGEYDLEAATRDQDVVIDLPEELADGSYYLNWRVISADSHPIAGVLTFSVGDAEPGTAPAAAGDQAQTPTWPGTAAAALHYLGLLVFIGYLCFRIAIVRGTWPGRPRHRILRASAATAVLGAGLAVPLGAVEIGGLPLTALPDAGSWSGLVQVDAVAVLALTAIGLLGAYAAFAHGRGRWAAPAALVAAAVAVAAPVLVGHSMTFGQRWLMIGADTVHLATGAIWAGGLAGLLVTLTLWHRSGGDPAEAARIVARFSACAGYTVALLGLSGLIMALSIHRNWNDFLASDHGRALIAKLALVGVALALAAWNRFRLVPKVTRTCERPAALARLRRILAIEGGTVATAIVLTGLLVHLSPTVEAPAATPPSGGEATVTEALGDGEVNVHLTPGMAGENTIMLTLTDAAGLPLEPLEAPAVSAVLPEERFGPIDAIVHDLGSGQYHCLIDLPLDGTWEITVQVRISEFESATATLTADVGRVADLLPRRRRRVL